MREATTEVSLLVIVAISVAIMMAFFFGVIWPHIRNNYQREANCKNAICDCRDAKSNDYMCKCWASLEDKETNSYSFTCAWEG